MNSMFKSITEIGITKFLSSGNARKLMKLELNGVDLKGSGLVSIAKNV